MVNHTWLDRLSHVLSFGPLKRIKRDRITLDKQTASARLYDVFSIFLEVTRPRIVQDQEVEVPLDNLWSALLVFYN